MIKRSVNKMGTQPISKLLLSMGIPMILSMALQALYNIVDSYFVSSIQSESIQHLGDYAINALALAFPIQMLMIAVGVGTGVGVNALISKNLGANNRVKAASIAGNAIFLGLFMYLCFLIFSIWGVKAYVLSQTDNKIIADMSIHYVKICTMFSLGIILTTTLSKILQATGRTLQTTIAQMTGAFINMILDPILIFGLLGVPKLGVAGAAYATVIGQTASLLLNFIFYKKHCKHEFDTRLLHLKPQLAVIKSIYAIGLPAIMMQSLTSFMTYSINIIFLKISLETVAAYGIYYKIQQFALMAMFGLNNALIPILGFNYGMKNRTRVLEGVRYGLQFIMVISVTALILFETLANPVAHIFELSNETRTLYMYALRIIPIGFIFMGANIAYQGIFQAFGHGMKSFVLSLLRLVIIVLPIAWILSQIENAKYIVWISFPIAEGLSLIAALVMMSYIKKNTIETIPSTPSHQSTKKDKVS